MTYSKLGIPLDTTRTIDPQSGKEKVVYMPQIDPQRGKPVPVPLYKSSRLQGTYVIGGTGTGKSGLLENLIMQDIDQQIGVCVLDPHGDLIDKIIARVSEEDITNGKVILLDFLDTEYQGTDYFPGLNIYQCDNPTNKRQAQETYERIKHIFNLVALANTEDKLGVRISQGIRNSAFTFIDSSPIYGCTMLELPMLFTEDTPRTNLIAHLRDDTIRINYWENFFNPMPQDAKRDRADMVLNKIEGYTTNRLLRPVIGQSRTTINFRDIMDTGKIVLVKLPGEHEEMTELLGSLIIAQLLGAAFSRKDTQLGRRRQFNIYCDEFELYATDDFTRLLKECRKYGMAVTIAHQSRDFLDLRNQAASMQVTNIIIFKVTFKDAEKELAGQFDTTPPPPQQEEIGKDAVITYKRDVVGHLLHQGHENPAVEQFINEYLQKLQRAGQQRPELNMRGGIAGKSVVYGKNTEVRTYADDILPRFTNSGFLPSGKYLSNEKIGMFERFHERFDHDNFGVYWYDPGVIQQDLLELNTFLYDAMRGKIADAKANVYTSGFLHGVGHWGLSAYLGFDTYYYVTYCSISPQVKEAYLQIMNATREYYQRRDVQLGLFGLSAFPGDEEEYQRLGEELRKLEAQIEKAAVSSTLFYIWRADPPYVHGVTEAHTITRNENLLLKEYQEAAFVDVWDTPILHAHYFHNFGDQGVRGEKTYFSYPANREPGKWLEHYQFDDFYRALAHVCTNYACLQGINLPDIPKEKQREVRLLMQQKWEIILRRAYLSGKDPKDQDGKASSQLREWSIKEITPWLAALFRDPNACDLSIKAKVYDAEKNRYHWFIESLLAAIEGLKQDPISTRESGKYEVNMRPGIQLSSAEMQARIANELSNLPNYIARVRITNDAEELVEYTIKTLKPDRGVEGATLKKRIERIRNHMIAMKYCRAEVEIDEEIRKRHESLRQAQAVSVNKPQQPTSQTSRHARQVPVQGKCPNCGFSKNPSEARFCMQCGTKLT